MMQIVLTSSVLILVVAVLRYALRGRISLRMQYALWLLVAARLLIPVTFGSTPVSVLNAAPAMELPYVLYTGDLGPAAPAQPDADAAPAAPAQPSAGGQEASARPGLSVSFREPAEGALPANTAAFPLSRALAALWCGGMAVMAAWFLWVNLAFRRKLKRSAAPVDRPGFPLRVYVSGAIPSPCLSGLFRPAVYLTPACMEDEARLRHVLAHEYTHYRHGDHLWALARCLCLTVYWFNPLVWWAAALSRRDCELACDEGALRRLGEEERTAYGRTLIGLTVSRARAADLLEAATTMTAGKGGLKERILLIAKRPKMMAVTAAAVILIAAVAVACTFTGADTGEKTPADLEAALTDLPADLAGQVTVYTQDQRDSMHFCPDALLEAYHTETRKLDEAEGYAGGWICSLLRYDQAGFESAFLTGADNSGLSCFARDDAWYYALQCPTDVQWVDETRADYEAAYDACIGWVTGTVLAWDGVEPFSEADYLSGDYTYEGAHYDVKYFPYLHVNGDLSVVYTLVLSQPAAQGAGGVWCVERCYDDNGNCYPVRPDTELTAAEYFADLQARADGGEAEEALDPLSVCLDFAQTDLGHQYAYEDNFELGEPYQGARAGEIVPISAADAVRPVLEAFAAGDTVRFQFEPAENSGLTAVTLSGIPVTLWNSPFNPADTLLTSFNWDRLYASQPPAADYTLTLWSADGNHSITVYGRKSGEGASSAESIVRIGSSGTATWYSAHYFDPSDVFAKTICRYLRDWFDEAELHTLRQSVAVTPGEAGWPEHADLVPGYVARTLAQEYWEVYTRLTPGSRFELDSAQVLSVEVYDMDSLDDPTQICFDVSVAIDGENLTQKMEWVAGAGIDPIEEGAYAGMWRDAKEVWARLVGSSWQIIDVGTGGYWTEGHDGTNSLPDVHTCSHYYLLDFLLNRADGAYAEGGQYELGDRFLADPGGVLDALRDFVGAPVARWSDYTGDGAQWLAERLVSEFTAFRDGAQDDALLAALEGQASGDRADMAQLVLDAYRRAAAA